MTGLDTKMIGNKGTGLGRIVDEINVYPTKNENGEIPISDLTLYQNVPFGDKINPLLLIQKPVENAVGPELGY